MTPESLLKISSSSKFGGACSEVTLLLNFVSSSFAARPSVPHSLEKVAPSFETWRALSHSGLGKRSWVDSLCNLLDFRRLA